MSGNKQKKKSNISGLELFSSPILLPKTHAKSKLKKEVFITSAKSNEESSKTVKEAKKSASKLTPKPDLSDDVKAHPKKQHKSSKLNDNNNSKNDSKRKISSEEDKRNRKRMKSDSSGRRTIRIKPLVGITRQCNEPDSSVLDCKLSLFGNPEECQEHVVVVSCVSPDYPYKCHPFQVKWKDGSTENGVISKNFQRQNKNSMDEHLSIDNVQIVPVEDPSEIETSLNDRKSIRVDPFRQGFDHVKDEDLKLSNCRLCFQVFLKMKNGSLHPLKPALSNVLEIPKLSTPDADSSSPLTITSRKPLKILKISDKSLPANGNKEIIIWCENLRSTNEVEILFEHRDPDTKSLIWDNSALPSESNIGDELVGSISFLAPPYKDSSISEALDVQMYLIRMEDKVKSLPQQMTYVPVSSSNPDTKGQDLFPKVCASYSIARLPISGDEYADESGEATFCSEELALEMEANKILSRRLQQTLISQKKIIQSKENLARELEQMTEQKCQVQSLNDVLSEKVLFLESELTSKTQDSLLSHLQTENDQLRSKVEELTQKLTAIESQFKDQKQGVSTLEWLLEQKMSQIKLLEAKLREIFPNSKNL